MRLGDRISPVHPDWRFVEDDLYDTARRVREYDPEAALVRETGTGHLGLARRNPKVTSFAGSPWQLARPLFDLDNDRPLTGCPDARVLACQRAYDSWRIKDMRTWHRRSAFYDRIREARQQHSDDEWAGEHAEGFMHAMSKDSTAHPRTYISRDLPD